MSEYPSENDLKKIREWKIRDLNDFHALMEFVWERWHYANMGYFEANMKRNVFKLHTAGWSGNEDIIAALQQNETFWMLYWEQSRRGGHYTFQPVMEGL